MQWSEVMDKVYQSWQTIGKMISDGVAYLSEFSDQLIQWLVALFAQWGVPEEQRLLAAYGSLYLLATLFVVLLVWRMVRRRKRRAQRVVLRQPPEVVGEEKVVESYKAVSAAPEIEPEPLSFYERMRSGLAKTNSALFGRIDALFGSASGVNSDLLEELEEILITADFGMKTTQLLIGAFEKRATAEKLTDPSQLRQILKEETCRLMTLNVEPLAVERSTPFVLLVIGVNGVGKTTTIGKLAQQYTQQGKKVILGAADTFRAAAAEQLSVWGERTGVTVIRHDEGSDPAAVAFDAAKATVARNADMLILDTAGRLHTKVNLMEEMKKIYRVLGREIPDAPHETLLVLDATTGQNALVQARLFQEAVGVTGIALTKLDGTAKGGMAVAIGAELGLPVRFIGIGEGVDDLRPFDPEMFVDALFENR
ncbi:MAG: signal recognition particle-docking protein FtsY [Desulfuromonas sp.]|nr:signal recognition particle-docking protein FtsY [Desulfuromonas sp.]